MATESRKLTVFPAFFRTANAVVAIVGDGEEALAKGRLVAQTDARIRFVAPKPSAALSDFIRNEGHDHIARSFRASDLDGATLVFVATGDKAADEAVAEAGRARGIPVNVVDRPNLCDFFTPAIVNRAPVAIAIGSEGTGPVLTQMLRARIEALLSPRLGDLARLASAYRPVVETLVSRGSARRLFWRAFFSGSVASAVDDGDLPAAADAATVLLRNPSKGGGKVWLVGAGPGAEDLITLRAHRLLMEADAIVHDALVPGEIVAMGRRDAERFAVGKRKGCHSKSQDEINRLLVSLAAKGKRVVRLKSGDPLIYGRAAEEMAALRHAGIAFEVVPGITSAFAAAADMELPLTLRGVASSLVFTTGHDMQGEILPDWARLAISGATIAVYMGRSVAASVADRLIGAGLHADTAVAVVENASRADRRMFHGLLKDLPALETRDDLDGPVMVVIGDAVAGAAIDRAEPLAGRVPATVAA